jgi:hypothetical protein
MPCMHLHVCWNRFTFKKRLDIKFVVFKPTALRQSPASFGLRASGGALHLKSHFRLQSVVSRGIRT